MGRYAALLRGINVGGKNMLPMKLLAELFSLAGCTEVVTYIQSGNVVFSASAAVAKRVGNAVSRGIEAQLGLRVPVVVRSAEEMAAVVRGNPFAEPVGGLHVMFLGDRPSADAVAGLDAERSPGDRFVVAGADIYLALENGVARTKLTNAYFDSRLKTVSTLRSWRTVVTLAEMAGVEGLQDLS